MTSGRRSRRTLDAPPSPSGARDAAHIAHVGADLRRARRCRGTSSESDGRARL